MSNSISTEVLDNCVIVRFIRPEIRSPLSIAVLEELYKIVDSLDREQAMIFTGTENVFASGANLNEIAGIMPENAKAFARFGQDLMAKIAGLEQKTIAAINGYCFGGALDLTLACDLRIATPSATFAHPGAGLGIITGWGGTQRLPRLVGQANALEMFFTATPIPAQRAMRMGLVDSVENDAVKASLAYLSKLRTSEIV